MKTIEVDEALYRFIASHTLHIGESASEILRRMLGLPPASNDDVQVECELTDSTSGYCSSRSRSGFSSASERQRRS